MDFFSIVSGGLRRRTDYIHNVDVVVRLDGEKALGWPGMTFQVYGLNIEGRIPSDDAGDAQGLSNIAAPSATRLYEIWLEQSLAHDRFSLLAGLYDLNTEFDVIQSANVFLNPSHGIDPTFSQSGINGPSIFPYTTLAVRARVKPTSWSYIESAVLNGLSGDPDDPRGTHIILSGRKGILSATEAGYLFHSEKAASPKSKRRLHRRVITSQAPAIRGTIAAGIWYYTSRFDPIAPDSLPDRATAIRGDPGFYLLGERRLFRVGDDSSRGMSVFSRIGFADSRIYRFASYVGAGAVYTGLFESRPHDQLGFAMAIARSGDEYVLARHRDAPLFADQRNPDRTEALLGLGVHQLELEADVRDLPLHPWEIEKTGDVASVAHHPFRDALLEHASRRQRTRPKPVIHLVVIGIVGEISRPGFQPGAKDRIVVRSDPKEAEMKARFEQRRVRPRRGAIHRVWRQSRTLETGLIRQREVLVANAQRLPALVFDTGLHW
ncbi:MAG: carbohydrate porin [Acidobacteriota bacterium]